MEKNNLYSDCTASGFTKIKTMDREELSDLIKKLNHI